jgi:hypothetical protein
MKRLAFVLGVLAAGCGSKAAPSSSAPAQNDYAQAHILRTYKVPDGQDKRVERLLRALSYPVQVVTPQGTQTQFVRLGPELIGDGYMTLSAPAGIHDGVRELLDQLKSSKVPPPPATIDTTFWMVLGWPATERSIAPELKDVAGAIEALGDLGPMRFELLDRLQVATIDGEETTASGNAVDRFVETPVVDGDAIRLRLSIRVHGEKGSTGVDTSVNVKPGQFAVLGQAGYVPDKALGAPAGRASLFYVVRASTMK